MVAHGLLVARHNYGLVCASWGKKKKLGWGGQVRGSLRTTTQTQGGGGMDEGLAIMLCVAGGRGGV